MLPWAPTSTTIYLKQKLGEQSLSAWKTLLPTHSCKGPTPPRVLHNTNWRPPVKPTTLDFILFFFFFHCFKSWLRHSGSFVEAAFGLSSCEVSCGILVALPGAEPVSPALQGQILNHWTNREVPPAFDFRHFSSVRALLPCPPHN